MLYRFFQFLRSAESSADNVSVPCLVMATESDIWVPILNGYRSVNDYFLFLNPYLHRTPAEKLKDRSDFDDVTVRILSEDGIVNNSCKLKSLLIFRDDVYVTKRIPFNWNRAHSVKITGVSLSEDIEHVPVQKGGEGASTTSARSSSMTKTQQNVGYEIYSFFADCELSSTGTGI